MWISQPLLASTRVDFPTGAVSRTDYRKRISPPILHRKELLLPPDDPRLPKFRALTAAAEEHGLFREPNKIGTRADMECNARRSRPCFAQWQPHSCE